MCYKNDPDWPKVDAYLKGGAEPAFNYHWFCAQAGVAMASPTTGTCSPTGEVTPPGGRAGFARPEAGRTLGELEKAGRRTA